LKGKKRVAIIERAMPAGAVNGPLYNEIASLIYSNKLDITLENYIVGLGGRDVHPNSFVDIFDKKIPAKKDNKNYNVIGVRE
ncbi:MAG TPA: hypothetical protein PK800_06070, partial [Syntrophorhabdaceae bacterium]|nr:hypothetical protein [Syntrophorhabdaceae bacterium]